MQRFKNILFFADGNEELSPALQRAAQLAESNQARLTLVDVIEPVDSPEEINTRFDLQLSEILKQHRKRSLEELSKEISRDDMLIYTKVLVGLPFVQIIKFVQRGGYDLVVKMARPPAGISQKIFGSIDLHLLRKCPCPVLIDRPSANPQYHSILAAVDTETVPGRGCDEQIMQLATSLAQRENATLDILHAWRLFGESTFRGGRFKLPEIELQMMLKNEAQKQQLKLHKLIQPYGYSADDDNVWLVKGDPAEAIHSISRSNNIDMIVMGTVGRVGIPGLLIGNTAEEVLQSTSCSVLAVKPAGFKSPVQ